jgi:hypothetical protein
MKCFSVSTLLFFLLAVPLPGRSILGTTGVEKVQC